MLGHYDSYMPLTVPRSEMFLQVGPELPVPQLMRMRSKRRRDPTKYYFYYRDCGHDTEDCHQFRDEIERLVRQGRLNHFIGERPLYTKIRELHSHLKCLNNLSLCLSHSRR